MNEDDMHGKVIGLPPEWERQQLTLVELRSELSALQKQHGELIISVQMALENFKVEHARLKAENAYLEKNNLEAHEDIIRLMEERNTARDIGARSILDYVTRHYAVNKVASDDEVFKYWKESRQKNEGGKDEKV